MMWMSPSVVRHQILSMPPPACTKQKGITHSSRQPSSDHRYMLSSSLEFAMTLPRQILSMPQPARTKQKGITHSSKQPSSDHRSDVHTLEVVMTLPRQILSMPQPARTKQKGITHSSKQLSSDHRSDIGTCSRGCDDASRGGRTSRAGLP